MKSLSSRILAVAVMALLALLVAGGTASAKDILQPDKLVILSTTDVKGKTSPCG